MNKQKNILAISYGDSNFSMSRDLNLWTTKHMGKATKLKAFSPEDIDSEFYNKNRHILTQKRG